MYTVTVRHHRSTWVKGDLDSEMVIEKVIHKKTRKEAKEYIERFLSGYSNVRRDYHKGNETSYCHAFTGNSWIEENSGEKRYEYYQLELAKLKV